MSGLGMQLGLQRFSAGRKAGAISILNNWYDPNFVNNYPTATEDRITPDHFDFAFLSALINCTQTSDDDYSCAIFTSSGTILTNCIPAFARSYLNTLGYNNGDQFKWGCWVKIPSASAGTTRRIYIGNGTSFDKTITINNNEWNWVEPLGEATVDSNTWQKLYLGFRDLGANQIALIRGLTFVNIANQEWTGELASIAFNKAKAASFNNLNPFAENIFSDNPLFDSAEQNGMAFTAEKIDVAEFGIEGVRFTAGIAGNQFRVNLNWSIIQIDDVDRLNLPLTSGYFKCGFWLRSNIERAMSSGNIFVIMSFISSEISDTTVYKYLEYGKWIWIESPALFLNEGVKEIYGTLQTNSTPANGAEKMQFDICGLTVGFLQNPLQFRYSTNSLAKSLPFYGLKYTSYGDSITAIGGYQEYVALKYGVENLLRAIGGSTIKFNNTIAWVDADGNYLGRPPSNPPAGIEGVDYFEVYSSMCRQERVDTIPLDTKLFTVMGGTNDWGQDVVLGTINDLADDSYSATFYAAVKSMFDKLLLRIPDATIFVVNTPYRQNELIETNDNGNYLEEFRQAIREVAELYNLPVIDTDDLGVNNSNWASYSVDSVHPNGAHCKLIGEKIIENI